MLPPNTQTLLFSATFPDKVVAFSQKFAPNANQIRLKQEELSVEGIKQFFMDCADNEAKYDVLLEIYNLLTVGQSIIFCRVRISLITNPRPEAHHSVHRNETPPTRSLHA